MNLLKNLFLIIFAALLAASCIEDGVSSSPADQPTFSTDTLDLGTVFVEQPTPTYHFVVYNRHDKVMNISSINFRDDDSRIFRMNVDGTAGRTFSNIEIRPNDSIYVFVEATVPAGDRTTPAERRINHIDFMTNGVTSTVVLAATGRDVDVHRALTVDTDTRWEADIPHQIFDSLVVAEGVTFTLSPGTELFFHDKARLVVRGRLVTEGTPERPVVMGGDRTDNVVGDIPFDLMASQWSGVTFEKTASGSRLSHTVIKNMTAGVEALYVGPTAGGAPGVELINCRIRNSAGCSFYSWFSDIRAVGTEFSDAALTPLYIAGGRARIAHSTVANYYLFAPAANPMVTLYHTGPDSAADGDDAALPYLDAQFDNCIFYGLGTDFTPSDLNGTEVYVRRSVFKSDGSDDDHFIGCVWDTDPLYFTVREDYVFDYRLRPDSPVAASGDPSLTPADAMIDFYGVARDQSAPSPGAFQWILESE